MQPFSPVVTVDGPSGAGKGTVCRLLAEKLGWDVLDSGAIYRVLALAAIHHQISEDNEDALVPLAANLDVQFLIDSETSSSKIVLEGEDVTKRIRNEEVGAVAIMPLAAPIGSGLGIQNKINIKLIKNQSKVPVIVDAGVGQSSDAAIVMELGCDGVLINSAIAKAKKPLLMAEAMKYAVMAGRSSYLAGRMKKSFFGKATSPELGLI